MTDLTGLTHDELADSFGAHIREIEARLEVDGHTAHLRVFNLVHRVTGGVRDALATAGVIQPLSGGDPKPV